MVVGFGNFSSGVYGSEDATGLQQDGGTTGLESRDRGGWSVLRVLREAQGKQWKSDDDNKVTLKEPHKKREGTNKRRIAKRLKH